MHSLRCLLLCIGFTSIPSVSVAWGPYWTETPMRPLAADTTRPFGIEPRGMEIARLLPSVYAADDRSMMHHRPAAPIAAAPVAHEGLVGAYGNVLDIARVGSTLYIAGSFRNVGENTGGFVPVDARTGAPLRSFPKVAGTVHAMVPDGSGGWYLGGDFTAVGGLPRSCLAHVRADGSVSDWDPDVRNSAGPFDYPSVGALAICKDRLFVGGWFRTIGGQSHRSLGCVDLATGSPLPWNLDLTHLLGIGNVNSLHTHGTMVFVGGSFDNVGGEERLCLAAIDATAGEVLPWQADVISGVQSLLSRGNTLFIAGEFEGVAGQLRSMIAAIDIPTATLLPFDARARGIWGRYTAPPRISGLVLSGDTLFVGGSFLEIGGRSLRGLAALDFRTGDALDWDPPAFGPYYEGFNAPGPEHLLLAGDVLYAAGSFEFVNGLSQSRIVALDRATGAVRDWNPRPDLPIEDFAVQGDTIFLAGYFSFMGDWRHRAGLAAIDLTTGALKPWNPNPNGSICSAIEVHDGRVYVSGDFTIIGGAPAPRNRLAALDTLNGEVLDWDFGGTDRAATSLLLRGDTLFAAGAFSQFGGQPRAGLASVHAITGEVTSWAPQPIYDAKVMARIDETIYFGGLFDYVAGQRRRNAAAVDAITGELLPWNPDIDNFVEAIAVSGDRVYLGGAFSSVGGQPRRSLAAVDAITGAVSDWNPTPVKWYLASPHIKALALHDSSLWVGGNFSAIGGQQRRCLAVVDTVTGVARDWDPQADDLVWSLASAGNSVFVGGGFTRVAGLPSAGIAAFTVPLPPPPIQPGFALVQSLPNPTRATALIRFTLAHSARTTLTIHDLQGRRVATLLEAATLSAGPHEVLTHVSSWEPGVYLYRLQAGDQVATRKFVVLD